MKILATADWHVDNQPFGGRDNRILRSIKALQAVSEWCNDNDVNAYVICGDLFEKVQPLNRVIIQAKWALEFCKCNIYTLTGNHDRGELLIDSPISLTVHWRNPIEKHFHCIDYCRDSADFLVSLERSLDHDLSVSINHSLIFCHQYFEGLYNYKASDRVEVVPLKLLLSQYTQPGRTVTIVSGHYHKQGFLKLFDNAAVYSIGIPICQSFGDINETNVGLVIEGNYETGYHIREISMFGDIYLDDFEIPDFYIYPIDKIEDFNPDLIVKGEYYRFDLGDKLSAEDLEEIISILKQMDVIYQLKKQAMFYDPGIIKVPTETNFKSFEILDRVISLHKPADPEGVKQEALTIMGEQK
uniref:Putative calcineurin-like phosphoesterase n=2 Tax=viral metagenome TaxID=1070528 RepID=A0A6M3K4U6_9ZZZZ